MSRIASPSRLITGSPCGPDRLAYALGMALWGLAQCANAEDEVEPASASASTPASAPAHSADEVTFDASFFGDVAFSGIDLSRFERDDTVLPGIYRVDIEVNGTPLSREDVRFADIPGQHQAQLCLSRKLLDSIGVDLAKLDPEVVATLPEGEFCTDLSAYVPDASTTFHAGEQRLSISVPQRYLRRSVRGWVDPSHWDHGINAAMLGYRFNHFGTQTNGSRTDSSYLSLDAGLNLGPWRLRHSGAMNWSSQRNPTYTGIRSYVQRDVTRLQAQLIAGDTNTVGDMFDAVNFRGVTLASDDRMLPDSQRGYAPVVRGVALTNAVVSIHQRGYEIYQTTVAPGAFEIDDLYATGYGGDLDVVVTEADGREQRFTVPYAAVPQLLRAGTSRFSVSTGQLRQAGNATDEQPWFVEGTVRRGLSNSVTTYGGAIFANNYSAVLAGGAINTRLGAFSADITAATAKIGENDQSGGSMSGQSARLTYSKLVPSTGTNFALAAYRYSTSGYVNLADATRLRADNQRGDGLERVTRQRSRLDANLSQALGDGRGSFWLNGNTTTFWNRGGTTTSFSLGYSNSLGPAQYSLSAQRLRESFRVQTGGTPRQDREDTQLNLTISMPLGRSSNRSVNVQSSVDHSAASGTSSRLGLSGSAGDDRQWNYSASVRDSRSGTSASLNGGHMSPYGSVSAGYTQGNSNSQYNVGASGALLLHGGGLTVAQQLGETMALIRAEGAKGASVDGNRTLRVDGRGHAVMPHLQPYQMNTVHLDTRDAPLEIEFDSTTVRSAPRAGAVVKLEFQTEGSGMRAALIKATQPDGSALPFGADVLDAKGQTVGVVGQASRLWLRGIEDAGELTVKWGDTLDQQCRIAYALPTTETKGQAASLQGQCVAMQPPIHAAPLAMVGAP